MFTIGVEITITVILTYITDSYAVEVAECTARSIPQHQRSDSDLHQVVFHFCPIIISSIPNFFSPQWIAKDDSNALYIIFVALPLVAFPSVVGISMLKWPQVRARGKSFGLGRRRSGSVETLS